jgi:hypothetical protein
VNGYASIPTLALLAALVGCATGGPAPPPAAARASEPLHVTSPSQSGYQAVTEEVVTSRLTQTIADIPANASVPRLALADIVYPASEEELKALGGFAILFVCAVSRDQAELPIDRVEVHRGAALPKLPLVTARRLQVTDARLAGAFGQWRQDAAYLLPMFTTRTPGKVVVYLGGGKFALTVLELPAPSSPDGPLANVSLDFDPYEPRMDALRTIIERELPVLRGAQFEHGEK